MRSLRQQKAPLDAIGLQGHYELDRVPLADIEATLRDVTSHELYDADELMAVTTAGGVTPINMLDGEPIGGGTPGPITVAIRDRFWALMDEPSPLIEAIDY